MRIPRPRLARLRAAPRGVVAGLVGLAAVIAIGAGAMALAAPGASPSAAPTPSAVVTAAPSASPTTAPTPTSEPSPSPTEEPSTTASTLPAGMAYADLDGVLAPIERAHRLPMAVMIDDYRKARPQSGFSTASIVYQAMIDDQSDRYMMVFQENDATDIGPVRSTRPYFVYWAAEYKALFGHFGGDAMALQRVVPSMQAFIYNEDALAGGGCPYHRVKTRNAPYNAYTNTAILLSCAAKRGYPTTFQNVATRTFADDSAASALPESQTITIPYLAETIGYRFDRTSDAYLRLVNGQLQTDPANGKQVIARNIVVLFQPYAIVPSLDKLRPQITNVGSGKAIVFKEGQAIAGTWKKTGNATLTQVYDASGNLVPLVRGEIFIQSVPLGTKVSYK